MGKKLLALFLALVMSIGMFAVAEDEEFIPDAIEDMIEEDFDEYFEEEDPIEVEIADCYDNHAANMEDDDIKAAADDDTTNLEMLASMFGMQTEKICWALHMTADEINALDAEELSNVQIEIELMLDDKAEVQADEIIDSGECGDNLYWSLDSGYTLTFTGSGSTVTDESWKQYADVTRTIVISAVINSWARMAPFSSFNNVKKVILDEGCTKVPLATFTNLKGLETIVFPDAGFSFTGTEFQGCSSLKEVIIPDYITKIPSRVFLGCGNLETVILPKNLKIIGSAAFNNCPNLINIQLPEGLKSIELIAFNGCTSLESITLPYTLEKLEEDPFYACDKISFNVYNGSYGMKWCQDNKKTYHVLDGSSIIAAGLCSERIEWQLDADGNLTVSGSGEMPKWTNSNEVPWSAYKSDIKTVNVCEGVLTLGDYSFYCHDNLTEIRLPSSLKGIGRYALAECTGLKQLFLPEGLETVGLNAITNTSITDLTVPETVKSISEYSFSSNSRLKTITVLAKDMTYENYTLDSFEQCAFSNNRALTTVVFADGFKELSNAMFENCTKLSDVTIPASVSIISDYAFWEANSNITIHCDVDSYAYEWAIDHSYDVTCIIHTRISIEGMPANCTSTGLSEGAYCSVCGRTIQSQVTIPALGHDPVEDIASEATCTQVGFTAGIHCSRCGAVIQAQKAIAPYGHKVAINEYEAPSCVADGLSAGAHCVVCDMVLVEQRGIPAKGHKTAVKAAVEATCTENGLTEGNYCIVCGEVMQGQEVIPATGHTIEDVAAVEASCAKNGYTAGTHCSVCGEYILKPVLIPATGHAIVVDATVEPTCEETGLTAGAHCLTCSTVLIEQNTIPAKGHLVITDKAVKATCTEEGLTEGKHCAICKEVLQAQEVMPASEHKVITGYSKQPTTTEEGMTSGSYCAICDEVLSAGDVIPPLGVYHTAKITIGVGETIEPAIIGDGVITFESTNPKAVAVDESGCITGIKAGGSAIITVTAENGYSEMCAVTVSKASSKVTLTKTAILNLGDTLTLTPTVTGTSSKLSWSSSNLFVASVRDGIVTAHRTGTATITVKTFNGKKATCKVTVYCAPEAIEISDTSIDLIKGKTATLKAALQPAGANPTVNWITSDADVATVSGGKVTAKGIGTCTITAITSNGIEAACSVNVTAVPTKVTLNSTKIKAAVGQEVQLSATVAPEAASQAVTWTTSNKSIATVENGVVTLLKAGTVKITAKTPNGKTAGCTITVTAI